MRLVSKKGKRALDLRRKSAAALLLSTCFLIPHLANVATAFQSDGLVCPAHPVHNSECGYVEGIPEQPCLHLEAEAHDENCYTLTAHHHTAECYAEPLESDGLEPPGAKSAESGPDNENAGDLDSKNESGLDNGDDTDNETGGGSDHENNNHVLEASASLLNMNKPDGVEPDTGAPESDPTKIPESGSQSELICQLEEGKLVRVLDCPHARGEHTGECGYAAAVEAVPCSHQCPEDAGIQAFAEEAEEESLYHAATEQQLFDAFQTLDIDNGRGTIMLDADFNANKAISISNKCAVTLDLNGHTVTFRGDDKAEVRFLSAKGNASLIIRDSAFTESAVTTAEVGAPRSPAASYSNGELIYYRTITTVSSGGAQDQKKTTQYTVRTNGRIIIDNSGMANPRDSIVYVGENANFTLESGMLANDGGVHNIVDVSTGKVEMSGGYLTGAVAPGNGGGILAGSDSKDLIISGGVIAANEATTGWNWNHTQLVYGSGGGVYYGGSGTFEIKGDTIITGNRSAGIGGGVYALQPGLLTLSNKVAIYGNTSSANPDCNSIAVDNGSILNNEGKIDTSKIKVGTNCEIEGVQEIKRGVFHSFLNEEWEKIKNDPGEKVITLTDSYTGDQRVIFPYLIENGVSFTLDLDGHAIEYDGIGTLFEIEAGGSLTIRDSRGTNETIEAGTPDASDMGSLSGNTLTYYTTRSTGTGSYGEAATSAEKHILDMTGCGRLYARNDPGRLTDSLVKVNGGAFLLESGILDNRGGMRNILSVSGTVTMTGGYLIGAHTSGGGNGGGILAGGSSGDITVSGGVIAANHAAADNNTGGCGGGIYSSGAANIIVKGSAVISGNTAARYGGGIGHGGDGDITLSGNASISYNRSGSDAAGASLSRESTNGGGASHTGTGDIIAGSTDGRVTVSCNTAGGYSMGGGLSNLRASASQGTVTIRNGAVISYNQSNTGGGISSKALIVDGGTIDHNTANHVGGGIMVAQGGGYAKVSATDDTKVYITNNIARDASGKPHGYAGGGIFVEHPTTSDGSTIIQSRLLVSNALITENHAMYGGGIGSCAASELYDFDIKGAAIFGNTAAQAGGAMQDHLNDVNRKKETQYSQDIYCASNDSRVSKTMLSMDDTATWSGIKGPYEKYVPVNDSEWNGERNHKFTQPIYLTAHVDPEIKEKEKNFAGVIISGNTSRSGGGGIGGNGHIQLGVERALIIEKHVESFIEADKNTKFEFKINLTQNNTPLTGNYIYTIVRKEGTSATHEFNLKNGELTLFLRDGDRATIYGLPEEKTRISYTVTEILEGATDFSTEVEQSSNNPKDTTPTFSADNRVVEGKIDENEVETLAFTNHKQMSVTVKKEWVTNGTPETNPQHGPIKVELLRRKPPEEAFQSFPEGSNPITITELGSSNGWTHTWTGLDGSYEYLVSEINVPKDYTSIKTVSDDRKNRTLTNFKDIKKLTVKKEWVSPSGSPVPDSLIPDFVEVVLIGYNAETGETKKPDSVQLTKNNGWSYTWDDLDADYTWRVEEVNIPEGYTYSTKISNNPGEDGIPVVIINTYIPPKASITLQKRWLDNPTSAGQRPEIAVQLLQNGTVIREAALNTANDWRVRWNDLDVQDETGNRYEYTVHELNVPDGYTYSGDKTFTLEKDKVSEISITNTAKDYIIESGQLTLSKRVTGAQTDQKFTFLFELWDADGEPLTGSYPYTEPGTGKVKYITDNSSVELAHNEQITVTDLPIGTKFIIHETARGNFVASVRTDGVSGSKAGVITEENPVHTVEYTNAPPDNPPDDRPPRDPHNPPDTPSNEPEPPADNPTDEPENPVDTPENPADEPAPPSEEPANPPENPEAPPDVPPEDGEYPTELPDPNDPNSPDEITIIGPNGIPLTYLKVWDPETEEWVYLPEDEIPLALMDGTPQTGDEAQPVLWGALCAASLGAGWMLLPRNRKKRRIRRNRQKHQS